MSRRHCRAALLSHGTTRQTGGAVTIGTLKTSAAYRTIPMDKKIIEVLKWHQTQQNKVKKDFKKSYND